MAISTDIEFNLLCTAARETLGLQLEGYQGRQLDRRLTFFRQRYNLASNAELARRLRTDPVLQRLFADFLTINVTEFFRNADRFAALQERYLPALLRERQQLRIWSAGCSTGAEIYSVMLLLESLAPGRRHQVLATDIDETSLRKARAGIYQPQEVRQVPVELVRSHMRETFTGLEISLSLRSQVQFRRHDLLRDPFPTDMDLILCRNVVIYFTEETKARVYRRFYQSLRPGGYLFLGATESILDAEAIGLHYIEPCFYQKLAGAGGSEVLAGVVPLRRPVH